MKKQTQFILGIGIFISGLFLGVMWRPNAKSPKDHDLSAHQGESSSVLGEKKIWTCAMHPQIRQPKPGPCPICSMDLIPIEDSSDDISPRSLKMSEGAKKLANIEVAVVERKFVSKEIRMVGKVDYDETRLAYITSWVPGRLDRLYVDYTGVPVKKGDHLVYIYSPEILTAQEELLQVIKTVDELKDSNVEIIRETAQATVTASREKLRLWGLSDQQIKAIENSGKATDHITIYSPMGGIVIDKNVVEGIYVQTGTRIYTIADLSQVWIKFDAYESDLPWLRYGQEIKFFTEAYPGEVFKGRIAFIDPVLNERTRTVKVRVNVANTRGKLKPNMFVRAIVDANIAEGGKVIDASLAGRWISPMHPEIIKNEPGACSICGMPLVKAESLGFVASGITPVQAPLVIPVSAPLITGRRAVVYVQSPEDSSQFSGREVTLGSRAGDYYIVKKGVKEGERVVTNGNFKIDSALQILAKPSMMSPKTPEGSYGRDAGQLVGEQAYEENSSVEKSSFQNLPEAFVNDLDEVLSIYFAMQISLSEDHFIDTQKASDRLLAKISAIDVNQLPESMHMVWEKIISELQKSTAMIKESNNLESARIGFAELSEVLVNATEYLMTILDGKIVRIHCPMAFNSRGADWLQNDDLVKNPYFGNTMPDCGTVLRTNTPEPLHEGSHRH